MKRFLWSICFIFIGMALQAATIDIGIGKAYATINEGLAAASNGDTLLIYDGVYQETLYLNKSVTLEAVNIGGAILDGSGSGMLINGNSNATIKGLHLRNANYGMYQRDVYINYVVENIIVSNITTSAFEINNGGARSGNFYISNATVVNAGYAARINDGGSIIVKNSILYNITNTVYEIGNGVEITPSHNLLYNTNAFSYVRTPGVLNTDSYQLNGDPMFVNEASGDFRLSSGSIAIDSGENLGLAFSGVAPDIGALEYMVPEMSSLLFLLIGLIALWRIAR